MKTRTCEYSHTVGLFSDLGRGFQNPVDVAIGRNGLLYVLCRAQDSNPSPLPYKRITMLMVNGDYLGRVQRGRHGRWKNDVARDRLGRRK